MTKRTFDVVVWGATGFTGRLVAEYMVRTYGIGGDITWAVAGRSASKLESLRKNIAGSDADGIPQIVADSQDETSLRNLVAATRVVCSTVGPYAMYGSLLVQFCAEQGTHYCDLAGEIHWMCDMMERHGAAAEASGARIVHSCGFDCIPSDLGTYFVQSQMQERHGVYATR
ncbi:MAG: saccharopine dehydrogenase, partial [Gammaproteobacteria bacterium]|nr:saccharopine dehydrogenase [Gammaproteobacteria bacterium]